MRKFVAGLALGLGSAAVVLAIGAGGWLDRAEMATYDWRTKLTADHSPANPEIVLVEINDSSVRDLSPFYGRWPWPRLAFADLITYLNRAPATVIAVDFTFPEEQRDVTFKIGGAGGQSWTGEQSDKALVDAVRKANVILLADANYAGNQGGEQVVAVATWTSTFQHLGSFVEERPSIVPPFQALTDAGRGLAHNFLPLDSDGIARRMPPFVRTGDRALPFLGVAAAIAARDLRPDEIRVDAEALRMGDRTMPLVGERVPDPLDARRTHVQRLLSTIALPRSWPMAPDRSRRTRRAICSSPRIRYSRGPHHWSTLRSSRTRSCSSDKPCQVSLTSSRRPSGATSLAFNFTPQSQTAFCPIVSCAPRALARGL